MNHLPCLISWYSFSIHPENDLRCLSLHLLKFAFDLLILHYYVAIGGVADALVTAVVAELYPEDDWLPKCCEVHSTAVYIEHPYQSHKRSFTNASREHLPGQQ